MKVNRNDACYCGSGKKYKECHMAIDEKLDELRNKGYIIPEGIIIKTKEGKFFILIWNFRLFHFSTPIL